MFYVCQRDSKKSKLQIIEVCDTLVDVMKYHPIDSFSVKNSSSEVLNKFIRWEGKESFDVYEYYKVCFNHNEKLVPYTELVGAERERKWQWMMGPRCWYGPNYKRKRRMGKKGGKGWRFRKLHTTPERRAAFAVTKEDQELYGVRVRAARNARNIPNSYDDFHATSEANWKNYRKTQWKQ